MDELIGKVMVWGEEYEFHLSGWQGKNQSAVDLFNAHNEAPFDQYEPDPLGAIVRRIAQLYRGKILFLREPAESEPGVVY
jgi:hypothetical protein